MSKWIALDWVSLERTRGYAFETRCAFNAEFAHVSSRYHSMSAHLLLPAGVGLDTVVLFLEENCPTLVRCNTRELTSALANRAGRELMEAERKWKRRATLVQLALMKNDGWRFVHASVTVDVVLLADGNHIETAAREATEEYVSDCGVDVHPLDAQDIASESSIEGWGLIYGDHGFEVHATDALAVFSPKAMEKADD